MNNLLSTAKKIVEYGFNAGALKQLSCRSTARIFLFLSPQYLNYGDHAIALSELDYLKKALPQYEIVDVNFSLFQYWPEKVKAAVQPRDIVVVTGGGFMGNLWPDNEKLTEQVVASFPNNRIIFAPQTLFFHPTAQSDADKARFQTLLKTHGNFRFFARDVRSCTQMEELGFQRDRDVFLMPDFVLFLQDMPGLNFNNQGPVLCLRSDDEAVVNAQKVEKLVASAAGKPVKTVLMAKDHVEIPVQLRKQFVKHKLQQYADADFVITDRLHTMLFCAYTGTPCIAFDNISKKVSGVYQWIARLEYIRIAQDLSALPELISQFPKTTKEENRKAFFLLQSQLGEQYLPTFSAQFQ